MTCKLIDLGKKPAASDKMVIDLLSEALAIAREHDLSGIVVLGVSSKENAIYSKSVYTKEDKESVAVAVNALEILLDNYKNILRRL